MNSNGLDHSQPASIVLNPGPAGSIIVPVAGLLIVVRGMIAAFKAGESAGRRGKQ